MSAAVDPGTSPDTNPPATTSEPPANPEPSATPEPWATSGATAVPDPPEATPDVEDPAERRRRGLKRSAVDMVRSMLVIVGILVVIVLVVPRPNQTPMRAVDVATVARGAAQRLPFPPAVPQVPSGWTANSAEVRHSADDITTWHIGYVTADGHYASVEQAAEVDGRWIEILSSGGLPQGTRTVDGTAWEVLYKDVRHVHTLIHRGEGLTTMITSKDGGLENAEVLARSIPVALR